MTCRGNTGLAIVNPPAHQRSMGKHLFDIFGGAGDLAKTTDHLVLRGFVLKHEVLIQMSRE